MTREFSTIDRLEAEKLFERIRYLSSGSDPRTGVTRASYGDIETQALLEIRKFAARASLETYVDTASNLWVEPTRMTSNPAIWIGSHIDSVPNGGNYDGLAGIVAGLLVLSKIEERAHTNQQVRLVALRGEESAWFGVPYLGAKALLGQLREKDLDRVGVDQEPLREHMRNCGADVTKIANGVPLCRPHQMSEFWELHIEQGPVLVAQNKPIGIVTDIRGNMRAASVHIKGQAGHSGTTPRELRHDAVFAFTEFITTLDTAWKIALEREHDLVVTCGKVATSEPCNITRIPDSVKFSLEWRSRSTQTLLMFAGIVDDAVEEIAKRRGVEFDFGEVVMTKPAKLDQNLATRAMMACVFEPGVTTMKMPSGAGHDAAIFANAGIATGMIFVRNANGSHNPDEAMDMDDFMLGVELLYKMVTG